MTVLQQYQLWIGLGFVILLVVFLIVVFFVKERLTDDQRQILRFLSSLCGGFAGALITGDALFKLRSQLGQNTTLAISGAAGFALFFAVWFTSRSFVFPDAISFSVPEGWTFKQTADALVQQDNAVIEFVGFTQQELSTPLQPRQLQMKTMLDALKALRHLSQATNTIRDYDVSFAAPAYRLQIRT